jgi:beta-galactosidase
MDAKNVHLWHPDDPYLHFLRTEVLENGKIVDSFRTRFGIRLYEMRGKEGPYINKKPYGKLVGVNRHQDYAYVGNALPNSGQWRDVKLLREGGTRIIRAAHYPMSPAFYDACDELGMLVTSATPGWQYYNFQNPLFKQRLCDDTRSLVRRDRNRPSLLFWETAINETRNQPVEVLKEMHCIAHEENPFPSTFTATETDEARNGGFDVTFAVDQGFTREYGDGDAVDNYSTQNSKSRIKLEWGEIAALEQASVLAPKLDSMYRNQPGHLGGALWCGIDHQRGYHPDPFWGGLLNIFRLPRYSYYLYKSQYNPDYKVQGIATGPMVYITNELTQVSPTSVVVYSNCQQVRLTWRGKVIETKRPDSGYKSLPHPPFTFTDVFGSNVIRGNDETALIAEGLIDGEVVVTQIKKYAMRTRGVRLVLDGVGMGLTADGSDFIPVRAYIVDEHKQGVEKVLASEYVYFTAEGPGEIIGGVANQGNPVKTEFGVATALLRSTTVPGNIKVKAYVKGLKSDEISVTSIASTLPFVMDTKYVAQSKKLNRDEVILPTSGESSSSGDIHALQDEVIHLKQELTGREQEVMEMRRKLQLSQ